MMMITIEGKEYEVHFGIAFVRELDKKHSVKGNNGVAFGLGLETVVPKLFMGDVLTLADVLLLGTGTEKNRPTSKEVDKYIDEVEDIEAVFDEVLEELKKQNATKKKATKMITDLKAAEEKEKK